MLLRTAATAFVCLAIASSTTAEAKQIRNLNKNASLKNWETNFQQVNNTNQGKYSDATFNETNLNLSKQLVAKNNRTSYMKLTPTSRTNRLGNPIYFLEFYVNGQLISKYDTVAGRSHTQNKDRHKSGTEAPLPDGRYTVAKTPVPGTIREAGKLFLPVYPSFQTGRSALGVHYDPSYEKNNGEDGTSGCIGLTNQADFNKLLNHVRAYQPQYLTVDIQ